MLYKKSYVLAGVLCLMSGANISAAVAEAAATPAPLIEIDPQPKWVYLDVLRALENQGYRILSVRETLLNRILIRADNPLHLREIIVSRTHGQILRDIALETYVTPGADMPPLGIGPNTAVSK